MTAVLAWHLDYYGFIEEELIVACDRANLAASRVVTRHSTSCVSNEDLAV